MVDRLQNFCIPQVLISDPAATGFYGNETHHTTSSGVEGEHEARPGLSAQVGRHPRRQSQHNLRVEDQDASGRQLPSHHPTRKVEFVAPVCVARSASVGKKHNSHESDCITVFHSTPARLTTRSPTITANNTTYQSRVLSQLCSPFSLTASVVP
jgi:hypothetical protein